MSIARLKITLDDVEPKVLHRIEVPASILLSDLHLVIQAAMPWWNYHLYEFRVREMRWGLPDPEFDWPGSPRVLPAKTFTLADLIGSTGAKTIKYLYDFGDGWEHAVKIEKIVEPEPGATYPRLVDAKGRCPPEDAGGPWGYADYLKAIADPSHENHEDMIRWRGPGFDPNTVDAADIEKEFAKLARKWARKATKPPPKPKTP
jgi:Plasmid pRiA4b ORF-3-like protein